MSLPLSVVTCAHNPRPEFLDRTMQALQGQALGRERWEFLLIDNVSSEPLAESVDLSWHPQARHIREGELGLTAARLRGISEARGEVLVFVDDDNVLDADYLEQVLAVAQSQPMIGAWSGHIRPEFEEPAPPWTKPYWGALAIRTIEHDAWSNLPHLHETMPCGAGLCVRREVAERYKYLHDSGQRSITLDRAGKALTSGGDNDLAACACDIGLGIGLFAGLKMSHLIPPGRLRESYLLRLAEGISYSGLVLGSFRAPTAAMPRSCGAKVADLLRYIMMSRRERRFHRARTRGQERAMRQLRAAGTFSEASGAVRS